MKQCNESQHNKISSVSCECVGCVCGVGGVGGSVCRSCVVVWVVVFVEVVLW